MKKVLMVVFHYPPVHGSSGVHRTLNFSRFLPDYGWQPIVLTATPGAYPSVSADSTARIPSGIRVERATAIDSSRHLSFRGAYLRMFALPDPWISWWPTAVVKGLTLIRRYRPDLLWSTFPIGTAHLIGLTLHRLSGIPWVADFRDPMIETDPVTGQEFPEDPATRRVHGWIERPTIRRCAKAVFTTPGTAQQYASRFADLPVTHWNVIPNGFDEESFEAAERLSSGSSGNRGHIVLVHSGGLYPELRDPDPFFVAVSSLRRQGVVSNANLRIVLRASGLGPEYRHRLVDLNIADIVSLEDSIPYERALAEMLAADGLLLFQASNCNWQIPAKVYEYLRARRPIFALTDTAGDTAKFLLTEKIDTIVPIDSSELIARGLVDFLRRLEAGSAPLPDERRVKRYSRKLRTQELAALLNATRENGV